MSQRFEVITIARQRLMIRDGATGKRFRTIEACNRLNAMQAEVERLTAENDELRFLYGVVTTGYHGGNNE